MTQYEMISKVLSNFKFNEVLKTMECLDWKWATKDGLKIPDMDNLYNTSRGILEDAIELAYRSVQDTEKNSQLCRVATGGFRASARVNKLKEVLELELEFIVASWNVDNEDCYEEDNNENDNI